ncbi:hypothetical protein [Alistipes timonensis]
MSGLLKRVVAGAGMAVFFLQSLSAGELWVRKSPPECGEKGFATVREALACAAAGDTVRIFSGTYDESGLRVPDGVTIIGSGDVYIRGALPATTDCRTANETSTIDFFGNGKLENLTVTARNMRYPVHSDFSEGNTRQEVVNCRFIHYGSSELHAYRKRHGLISDSIADSLFIVQSAWGGGTRAGDERIFRDCYFESPMRAFSTHNNVDFHLSHGASTVILERCEMVSHGRGIDGRPVGFRAPVVIQSLESHTADRVILVGCRINGYLCFQNRPTHAVWCDTPNLKLVFNTVGGSRVMADQISVLAENLDWFPVIPQETEYCINCGKEPVARGKAVKRLPSGIGLMTSDDPADAFCGVALQTIEPGRGGEVKVRGYLPYPYFDGLWPGTVAEGDGIGVDGRGSFRRNDPNPVAYASDNGNIRIK